MATPSPQNPGYYEITVGPPGHQTVTTYRDDGTPAYTEQINADGTRTLIGKVGGEANFSGGQGAVPIATPGGPGAIRPDGTVLGPDQLTPTTQNVTPSDQIKDAIAGKTTLGDDVLHAKAILEKANLVGAITGVQAPGFDNTKINNFIGSTLKDSAHNPATTTPFVTPKPTASTTSTGPGTSAPTVNTTMPNNVGGTANRTGTQAAAPVPITAPTNGFQAGLTAGTVAQQPAITSQAIQAGQATAGQSGYAPAVQATSITAPKNGFQAGVSAGTVDVQQGIQAQQITAPQNNFQADVTAGTVGVQPGITGQQIGSTLTPDQQQAIALAKAQATGTAPSAAQALLQKGIDQNVGTAYGLAASLSGRNAGQALLQGSSSAQTAIAKSSADMAALRAQEIQAGTTQYGTVAGQAAGQELSAKQSNQSTDLQAQIATATNTINVLTGNRDAALKAGLQDQADKLTAEIENQKESLSALQSNQSADLTAKINTVQNTINVLTGNRDAALKAGLQNQADTLQAQINDANNALAALQSNQSTALSASTSNASNANAVNISNAANVTSSSNVNATNTTQANISSAANALTAQIQTATNNINVLTSNRDAALKAGMQNQADTLTSQINDANNNLAALQANLAATTQTNISNAGNATTLSGADLTAASAAMGLNSQQAVALQQMGLQAWVASLDSATKLQMANIVAQTAANSSNYALMGSLLAALGTVGAAYITHGGSAVADTSTSDRRAKTKIADGAKDVGRFLDSLTAHTWDYKDPSRDGPGRRLGVMAQDAGSTRMGRAFVLELPGRGGMLGLDPTKAIGPVLAGLAAINARLKKLEGRRG
jgi:Chaperone of endosialidase